MSTPTPAERPWKHQHIDATWFLNLEAAVNHDTDIDDNEAGSEDDFINNKDEDDTQENMWHVQLICQFLIESDCKQEELEEEDAGDDTPDKPQPHLPGHFNLMDELYAHIHCHKHSAPLRRLW